ncbi:protein-tyrosine phosphatase-like protein [Fomitopsis serialis]|uniref:protein-tyrosine phosphatase-like protein n=1 Tax=Fomitopsis serialis TaxID=139415 RepID=UPI002008A9A6|nr:protein-tyrosine phosphatase-like protein [Neoantrodia serialis]KAH9923845.1 protein-tyrosine phosphatase-like protein [Neoantrodia serialis]
MAVATLERSGSSSLPRTPPEYRTRSGSSPTASASSEASALRARARPIPNSYWATPFLVACEFPYCPLTPAQIARRCTTQKLDALLAAGVRTFIDLTEPHELFPYAPHLASACAQLGIDPHDVEYHSFPIRDRALPASPAYVRKVLAVLRDTERRGRVAAVHCRGGIGRTGLVVGCWLVDSGRARDGTDALRMIAEEWKGVEKYKRYPYSPETGPQFDWVRTWARERPPVAAATPSAHASVQ